MTTSVLAQVLSSPAPVTRVRVLLGESSDPARRGDKKVVAFSDCRYRAADFATLERCVEQIAISDEKLRSRPEDLMLWDWDNTFVEFDDPQHPHEGGGTVYLGVAWYDQEFFAERGGAGFSHMHRKLYQMIGIPEQDVSITHFLCADVAAFRQPETPNTPAALTAGATA